jgi:hypothetical protein
VSHPRRKYSSAVHNGSTDWVVAACVAQPFDPVAVQRDLQRSLYSADGDDDFASSHLRRQDAFNTVKAQRILTVSPTTGNGPGS